MVHAVRAMSRPGTVTIVLDIENAFNKERRSEFIDALIEHFRKEPTSPHRAALLRMAIFMYGRAGTATYTCPVTGRVNVIDVLDGVLQGNTFSSIFFNVGHGRRLSLIREAHPEVIVAAYHDDTNYQCRANCCLRVPRRLLQQHFADVWAQGRCTEIGDLQPGRPHDADQATRSGTGHPRGRHP